MVVNPDMLCRFAHRPTLRFSIGYCEVNLSCGVFSPLFVCVRAGTFVAHYLLYVYCGGMLVFVSRGRGDQPAMALGLRELIKKKKKISQG